MPFIKNNGKKVLVSSQSVGERENLCSASKNSTTSTYYLHVRGKFHNVGMAKEVRTGRVGSFQLFNLE